MASDAVIVNVANYPLSNGLLRALPGTVRDGLRVGNWLRATNADMAIEGFAWPRAVHGGEPNAAPWNKFGIEAKMQQLLQMGLNKTRKRLFFYASAHGKLINTWPAMPAVYCASHGGGLPDLFASGGWLPVFVSADIYDEYICLFDCCNEWTPDGPPPFVQPGNLQPRQTLPHALVMAACQVNQQALDTPTGGVFTDVLLEALSGSAGKPGQAAVSAADVVAYVKENVPIRAGQVKAGHVQTPVVWIDPNLHADIDKFKLFDRQPVAAVDVTALLAGRSPNDVEVLGSDLEPAGTVLARPGGAAQLPTLYPGKYVLRRQADGWRQPVRLKTTVEDDGSVVAKAEPIGAA